MKKLILISLLLLFTNPLFSQESAVDTTVVLKQVTLKHKNKKKKKVVSVDLDGYPAYNGLHGVKKIVSLVPNIPDGTLKYADFYFNTGMINLLKNKLKINYKDVELGLLIYDVNPDGTLGGILSENEIRFTVAGEKIGSLRVDISQLNIRKNNIYIGFEILSNISQTENEIYVRYNENDAAKTYTLYTYKNMSDKFSLSNRQHFKLELGVEID